MSAINVLSVMAGIVMTLDGNRDGENETAEQQYADAVEAVAATKELIESCQEMEARERGYSSDPSRIVVPRFRAALARCKGGKV